MALERFPGDSQGDTVRSGLALDCAIDGEIDEARILLGQFEPNRTSEYYRQLAKLARAIITSVEGAEDAAGMAREALGYAAKYPGDKSLQYRVEKVEQALLLHQPWAKGKVSRLRKQWRLPRPGKSSNTEGSLDGRFRTGITMIAFVVIVNAMRACSESGGP